MIPWLIDSWRTLLPTPWMEIAIACISLVCGAIIGSERERNEKPAGLRTLILVCLGACAYTMGSFCFTGNSGDTGRIVAQIVTGIGFLGAGVIMHGRNMISGATTAATIWVAAAIGITAGSGYCGGALGLSLLVRFVLSMVLLYEMHIIGLQNEVEVEIGYDPKNGKTRVKIEWLLVDYRISTVDARWSEENQELHALLLRLHLPRHHLRQLLDDIVDLPEVKSIREKLVSKPPRHAHHSS
jgi:putative Mg2+ transporter-C (MgtC) family protein